MFCFVVGLFTTQRLAAPQQHCLPDNLLISAVCLYFLSDFGISIPVGHADFFLNGGMDQAGCARSRFESSKCVLLPPKCLIGVILFKLRSTSYYNWHRGLCRGVIPTGGTGAGVPSDLSFIFNFFGVVSL